MIPGIILAFAVLFQSALFDPAQAQKVPDDDITAETEQLSTAAENDKLPTNEFWLAKGSDFVVQASQQLLDHHYYLIEELNLPSLVTDFPSIETEDSFSEFYKILFRYIISPNAP